MVSMDNIFIGLAVVESALFCDITCDASQCSVTKGLITSDILASLWYEEISANTFPCKVLYIIFI